MAVSARYAIIRTVSISFFRPVARFPKGFSEEDRTRLTSAYRETIVEKQLPNAFAGTRLALQLEAAAKKDIVVCGFMTHMCVSSTVRAALDLGYRTTVAASACSTRDLPDGQGGVIPASTVHSVALAELSDRFAVIAHEGHTLL